MRKMPSGRCINLREVVSLEPSADVVNRGWPRKDLIDYRIHFRFKGGGWDVWKYDLFTEWDTDLKALHVNLQIING